MITDVNYYEIGSSLYSLIDLIYYYYHYYIILSIIDSEYTHTHTHRCSHNVCIHIHTKFRNSHRYYFKIHSDIRYIRNTFSTNADKQKFEIHIDII